MLSRIMENIFLRVESLPETILPKSTAELLSEIDHEWSALMYVVDQLTPEQLTTPDAGGWSPKDNLAHLSEWLKILIGYHMEKHPAHEVIGVPQGVTEDWDMDVINKVLFERNRRRPTKEVLDELRRVHSEVVARVQAVPFDELLSVRNANDPEKQPLLNWVLGNTSGHFSEHRQTIEKILQN
jgi:hypothetical protein